MTDQDAPATLRYELRPLAGFLAAPRNPRQHDLGAIHASMDANGWIGAVLVDDRTGALVAGHGRILALRQRKERGDPPPARLALRVPYGKPASIPPDWMIPTIVCRFDDPAAAERALLADNRVTELADYDSAGLAAMLASLAETPSGLTGTAFDHDDLDKLLADLAGRTGLPTESPPAEPTPPSECRIEIPCTKAELDRLYPTLAAWRSDGITVHIQTA